MIPYAQVAEFVVGTSVALVASNVLIVRLERLGARFGVTEAALGLLAAFAADGPEITSAISALASGRHDIGVGVVLGSNVFNLAALLGLGAVVAGRIALDRHVVALEGVVAIWLAGVAFAALTVPLAPWVALLLAALAFGPYVVLNVVPERMRSRLPLPQRARVELIETIEEEETELREAFDVVRGTARDAWAAGAALLVVIGAALLMERTGAQLGSRWHISDAIVGGVILAAVTSLPNAVAAIHLARRGRGAATLSEAMNSNAINTVAGFLLPALFVGLGTLDGGGRAVATWYLAATLIVVAAAWGGRGIARRTGVLIIAGYCGYVISLAR